MAKILLFLFALRPLLDCVLISFMTMNAGKIPEASSYIAVSVILFHYCFMGLKEVFGNSPDQK